MPDKPSELKPCPFCGAGTTEIQEHAIWQGTKYAEPISVSVVHWCDPVEGQPSRMIQKVGRDRASAIAAWNRRTPDRAALAEMARLTEERDILRQHHKEWQTWRSRMGLSVTSDVVRENTRLHDENEKLRAALMEVARRATLEVMRSIAGPSFVVEPDWCERIVSEYLAEQAGKDSE